MNPERLAKLTEQIKAHAHGKNARRFKARFDTSDVSQEAAIQLLRIAKGDQEALENVNSSWLKRVAMGHFRKLRDHHSAQKRSVAIEQPAADPQSVEQITPEGQAINNEMKLRVAFALRNLDPRERLILDRYHAKNKTFVAIADEIGCSPYQVRKSYRIALKKLETKVM